jgi:hypothetical protein
MILKSPPQCGQWIRSKLNTRFYSLAQPKRIDLPCSGGSWLSVAAAVAVNDLESSDTCGTTFERHFAFSADLATEPREIESGEAVVLELMPTYSIEKH